MRTGVLLINFGGPATLAEVGPFLQRLFNDRFILPGLPGWLRRVVAWTISTAKGPSSRRAYAQIGGGSPQWRWTCAQRDALAPLLAQDGMPLAVGLRLSEPSIEQGLRELRDAGVERVLLLPLYPQYSTTTTGSSFDAVEQALTVLRWQPTLVRVGRWADHPGYLALLRKTLAEAVQGTPAGTHVLFSAHSLPMSIVKRGDPYPEDVAATVRGAAQGLQQPWTLAFQSRNGPTRWLEPYTEDEIERLGRSGVTSLVVAPVSFVSDHIETLFELDLLYRDLARTHGIQQYTRTRSFNGDPEFTAVLLDLARTALRGGPAA